MTDLLRLPITWLRRIAGFALALVLVLTACSAPPIQEPAATALPTDLASAPAPVETTPAQTVAQPTAMLTETSAMEMPPMAAPTQAAPATAGTQQQGEMPELNCASPADPTPAMTEGPYYTPDTPERTSLLEPGMPGTRLVVSGYVLTVDCQPVPGAWLDFWQADANGEYDNSGFRLRGHQFSDAQGRYQLETVLPGEYPGRTQHIHVKVQAPGGAVLTSQLFFPGAAGNQNDSIFSPQLVVEMQETEDGLQAQFNFILDR